MADSSRHTLRKNALEWSVFAFSLVLVVGVVGYLGVAAWRDTDAPPDFVVEWDAPTPRGDGGFEVPVHVRNEGTTTAANVQVEVTSGGESVTFTLEYVPRHSTREGIALFERYPAQPVARVRGYERP